LIKDCNAIAYQSLCEDKTKPYTSTDSILFLKKISAGKLFGGTKYVLLNEWDRDSGEFTRL